MTRRANVLVAVLVIVVVAQTVVVIRARRDVAQRAEEVAALKAQRALFCGFYHGVVQSNRLAMADARTDERSLGDQFYQLTLSPYLDLCHVGEQMKAKMAARNWGCERIVGGYDYPCLVRVARELEDAIPSAP